MVVTPYPTLSDANMTDMTTTLTYANNVTGQFLGLGFLIAIMGIAFLAAEGYPIEKRLLAMTFVGVLTSTVFAFGIGILAPYWPPLLVVLMFVAWILTEKQS